MRGMMPTQQVDLNIIEKRILRALSGMEWNIIISRYPTQGLLAVV